VVSRPEDCRPAADPIHTGQAGSFIATLGNFDGVHLGHQALIDRTVSRAHEMGCQALVLTFDPHPAQILSACAPPALTDTEGRLAIFRERRVDITFLIPFTLALASMSAADFCHKVLARIGIRELFVGHDSCLGSDRANSDILASLGQKYGFSVSRLEAVLYRGMPVSSTRIRAALAEGSVEEARAMLGRPHSVRGKVIHGEGRGGPVLGFPTANMDIHKLMLPEPAIYATSIRLKNEYGKRERLLPSVTSFGRNPTFAGQRLSLETHILDFDADIYGQDMELFFLQKLRSERCFDCSEDLVKQIRADVNARRGLALTDF